MARFTKENLDRALHTVGLYPHPRSALVPLLHILQEQDGYLTTEGMAQVAELLGLTPAEVLGTASFYDMLFTHPVGKYLVSVCTNIACMLNGAYELLEHAEGALGVKSGLTTDDGMFALEEVECIALCGRAPCLTVNWRFFGDVTSETFDALVDDLRAGRLDDSVPPHGTLSRVRRSVGLLAGAPAGAAPPPDGEPAPPADAPQPAAQSAPKAAPAPDTSKSTRRGGRPRGKGDSAPGDRSGERR